MKINKITLAPVIESLKAQISVSGDVSDDEIADKISDTFPKITENQREKAVKCVKLALGYSITDDSADDYSCNIDCSDSQDYTNSVKSRYKDYVSCKRFSAEEEQAAFREYIAETDPNKKKKLRNVILFHYTYLAVNTAYNYLKLYPDLELVDTGVEGIIEAIDKFDPDRGCRFSTYCVYWIKQKVTLAINKDFPVSIPTHIQALCVKVKNYVSTYYNEHGSIPSYESLAKKFNTNVRIIGEILGDIYTATIPIEHSGETEDTDDIPGIVLAGTENVICIVEDRAMKAILRKAVDSLEDRKRIIVIEKLGLDDDIPKNNPYIANMLNISRETVRTDYLKALNELRKNKDIIELDPFFDDDPSLY